MKILIVRFSSIGDIIMTTPVIRCLKKQLDAEIHFATKNSFSSLLVENLYIDKLILLQDDWTGFMKELKNESYDLIVDLHNNLRSRRLSAGLRQKTVKINKLNIHKQLIIYTGIDHLPNIHVAERGLETVKFLNVQNDFEGMDYFFPKDMPFVHPFNTGDFVTLALGTAHFTKNIPRDLLEFIIDNCPYPMIFLGGPKEKELGEQLAMKDPQRLMNMAGKCNLTESALYVEKSKYTIAGDTGVLHIAAALKKPTISIWGATIPEFGVFPYYGKYDIPHLMHQLMLSCRPCSKHGSAKCPKKHFNCMNLQDRVEIAESMNTL